MFMKCKVTVDTSHYPKEGPWELPKGWVWLSGEDIFLPMESTSPKGEFFEYIDIDAIDNATNCIKKPKHLAVLNAPSRATRKVSKGDVLFSMVRPYLRNIAMVELDSCIASTGFYVCRCSEILDSKYCYYLMLSNYVVEGLNQFMKGDNSPSINNTHITSWIYPIPPLSEQKRISGAIDGLLTYVGNLEGAMSGIVKCIDEVKSKLLDLAIHGKLVPQYPSDEPAIELLKRINPAFKPSDNLHYDTELPDGWCLAHIEDVAEYGDTSNVDVASIAPFNWVLELEDIEKDTAFILEKKNKAEREISGVRHSFRKGQVLYSKLRTYLNKVLIAPDDGYCTTEIVPITASKALLSEYLLIVLRSPFFLKYTASCVYGVKMPRLGTNDAKKAIIPIPPLAEQVRIVKKVSDLMEVISSL